MEDQSEENYSRRVRSQNNSELVRASIDEEPKMFLSGHSQLGFSETTKWRISLKKDMRFEQDGTTPYFTIQAIELLKEKVNGHVILRNSDVD